MSNKKEIIKKQILDILNSTPDMDQAISKLAVILLRLKPIEDAEEIHSVCDASIVCAKNIGRTEMMAQFYLMKAKAEISKPGILIHEMKNLTIALGWFDHALKSEKQRYEELDKKVNEIWGKVQFYLNNGFEYLNKKAYVGPAGYCYQIAGEVYGNFYIQFKLYKIISGRPWKSWIGMFKIFRFLNLDNLLLLDKESRKRNLGIKKDCLMYIHQAIRCFKEDKAWNNLADSYLALATEQHLFNNPFRCWYALYMAEKIINKHNLTDMLARLKPFKSRKFLSGD